MQFKSLIQKVFKRILSQIVIILGFFTIDALAIVDPIQQVEIFLNNMNTLHATIRQVNPNHSISTGQFYLLRPGKFRLNYINPKNLTIICNGQHIVNYEAEGADPTSIELKSTPFSFILEPHVSLKKKVTVTSVLPNQNGLSLTLVKTAEPEIGSLTLFFKNNPFRLYKWIINDGQGGRTEVDLYNIVLNVPVDPGIFHFQ